MVRTTAFDKADAEGGSAAVSDAGVSVEAATTKFESEQVCRDSMCEASVDLSFFAATIRLPSQISRT